MADMFDDFNEEFLDDEEFFFDVDKLLEPDAPIQEGFHVVRVEQIERTESKNTGYPMTKMEFRVTSTDEDPDNNRPLFSSYVDYYNDKNTGNRVMNRIAAKDLVKFLEHSGNLGILDDKPLNGKYHPQAIPASAAELYNSLVGVIVVHEVDRNDDTITRARIKRFVSLDEAEEQREERLANQLDVFE